MERLDKFMDALLHCDTVKVILTGCGESEFTTKEIHEAIEQLHRDYKEQIRYDERLAKLATSRQNIIKKRNEYINKLRKENAELKERLEKSVELPCKVGDTVMADVCRPYNGHTATICGEVSDVQTVVRVKYNSCRHIDFVASDFGKTVFLSYEAATAALKERERNEKNNNANS